MATLADCEVVTTERPFTVVTRQTALAGTRRVMVERLGIRNLPALRHSGAHLVTFGAVHFVMPGVAEADPEGLGELRRARITAKLMTCSAG